MFIRNPDNMSEVTREITPGCEAAVEGKLRATEKIDGTAVLFVYNGWWKRYTSRQGKEGPVGFIEAGPISGTGRLPGWAPVMPEDKWHVEAILRTLPIPNTTYELIGPKIQGNPYEQERHELVPHGLSLLEILDSSFDGLRDYLAAHEVEGIVFWDCPYRVRLPDPRILGFEGRC